jgi:hypothetical protein
MPMLFFPFYFFDIKIHGLDIFLDIDKYDSLPIFENTLRFIFSNDIGRG